VRGLPAIAGLLALLLLGACGRNQSIVAERPMSEVHSLLAAADELPPVFGTDEPDLRMDTADPKVVAWILSVKNQEIMRFIATLVPDGERRTSVDLTVQAPPKFEKRLNDNAAVRDFYLSAMREQVASILEDRPFDLTHTYPQMQKAIAANIGNITASAEAAAEASRKRERENIERAYATEAAGQ
jgi:hypothetical protein